MPKKPSTYSGRWVQRVPKNLHEKLSKKAESQGVSLNMLVATILAGGIERENNFSVNPNLGGLQAKTRRLKNNQE